MLNRTQPVGGLLREWRQRRRLSQLDLACDAGISTRHLSFVEAGRAHPSRDMLLHLSEQLDVPVRERNVLLVAAGYAPIFAERPLADPALAAARAAVDLVLERQKWPDSWTPRRRCEARLGDALTAPPARIRGRCRFSRTRIHDRLRRRRQGRITSLHCS